MERDAVNRYMRELCKLKEIDYVPPFRGRATHFLKRDVPFAQLEIDFAALNKRKEAEYERLNQVVRDAQTPRCRQVAILEYFGDTAAVPCGHCDRCLGAHGWPHLAQRMRGGPAAGNPAAGDAASRADAPAAIAQVGGGPLEQPRPQAARPLRFLLLRSRSKRRPLRQPPAARIAFHRPICCPFWATY
jgi:hypothetical protein